MRVYYVNNGFMPELYGVKPIERYYHDKENASRAAASIDGGTVEPLDISGNVLVSFADDTPENNSLCENITVPFSII